MALPTVHNGAAWPHYGARFHCVRRICAKLVAMARVFLLEPKSPRYVDLLHQISLVSFLEMPSPVSFSTEEDVEAKMLTKQ